MGDDYYNPWTAETHVKRVPFWQMLFAEVAAALVIVAVAWGAAVVLLSLERAS